MLTFGMGTKGECKAIDIRWIFKKKKIIFKVKRQVIKFNTSGVICTNP